MRKFSGEAKMWLGVPFIGLIFIFWVSNLLVSLDSNLCYI